jgi:hypothetical protein
MFVFEGLRECSQTCHGASFFVCRFEHYLCNLAQQGMFWVAKQAIYLVRAVSAVCMQMSGASYQSTRIARPLEFAKKSRLELALAVIVSIERLEDFVEMLI